MGTLNRKSIGRKAGLTRRDALAVGAGAGLLYAFSMTCVMRRAAAAVPQTDISAYIRIGSDESITILVGASEMGQGVTSGIAQVIAEELVVDWAKISVQTATPSGSIYANPLIHTQATFGSLSMRGYFAPARLAGATVREMLKLAAAQAFNVSTDSLIVTNGQISSANSSLTYGMLAESAAKQTPPTNPPLLGSGQYIGVPVPRSDIPSKVTGKAIFGIDVQLPGMVYAAVQNCPVAGGTVPSGSSFPLPSGALKVVPLPTAVAVVANDTYTAIMAAEQLFVNWSIPTGNDTLSSASILTQAQQLMTIGPVLAAESVGWAQGAMLTAAKAYDQTFSFPYLAHACLEVLNCTALVTGTSCTVWAPTQAPSSVVATAAKLTGLPDSAITVNVTYLGGGLGRKIEQDFIGQAIGIAMAMNGTAVKLTWSREQDFGADQYRPMALARLQAGLDSTNNVLVWWSRLVAPSYICQHGGNPGLDPLAIAGAKGIPYAFTHREVEYVRHTAPIAVGSWRSIGCSINTFVTESAVDELAAMAGSEPLAFRQKLLSGNARALAVLNAAATLGGWGSPLPAGHARGLAFCFSDNSYVAEVIEVSEVTAGVIQIHAVACAVDCGMAVNPDSVTAQIEGGIVHGLSSGLWGQIPISAGASTVHNFNNYRMMRMRDMPVISVQIINGDPTSLGGTGEISVPPVAPAVANAWASLTGQRIRSLPLFPQATGAGGSEGDGGGGRDGGQNGSSANGNNIGDGGSEGQGGNTQNAPGSASTGTTGNSSPNDGLDTGDSTSSRSRAGNSSQNTDGADNNDD